MEDYLAVTETSDQFGSQEQVQRIYNRYGWAAERVNGADVLEVACGAGQGLAHLTSCAKSLKAGDISNALVEKASRVSDATVEVSQFSASSLPFDSSSFDAVLLFEAIYYLKNAEEFLREASRVLRPGGKLLLVTANKDLFDFNPSPASHIYFGVRELDDLLSQNGYVAQFWGGCSTQSVSSWEKILRPIKKAAVDFGLMPKTMKGKAWLKRLVFGKLIPIPISFNQSDVVFKFPSSISKNVADSVHKVIYCEAILQNK